MKIRLRGLGMWGQPFEVPHNTSDRWKMRIMQEPTHVILKEQPPERTFETECEFTWSGGVDDDGVMIFDLVDVYKV